MAQPIWQIFEDIATTPGDDAKLKILQDGDSMALRSLIRFIYDKDEICLLPSTEPDYKPNPLEDNNLIYSESRRLHVFFKGHGYDLLSQHRREVIFIQMLEGVHYKDAKILLHLITKKRIQGLLPRVAARYLESVN